MTTREVLNVQSDYGEDITVYRPMFSKWELIDQVDVRDGQEAIYKYMDGDPQYPATIRLGTYVKAGKLNLSAKLETFMMITDDASNVTFHPWNCVIALSGPEGQTINGSYWKHALFNLALFSFVPVAATPALQASPVSGDNTIVNRMKFGVPSFTPSDMDDPATS